MKTAILALSCAAGALVFGQSVPEIPFDSNPDFFKLPDDLHFGETSGVAVNSQGQVYVYLARQHHGARVRSHRFPDSSIR